MDFSYIATYIFKFEVRADQPPFLQIIFFTLLLTHNI